MKKLILFLLLSSLSIFVQAQEVSSKKSTVTLEEGKVFQTDTIRYSDGSVSTIKVKVASDSATATRTYLGKTSAEAYNIATDMKACFQLQQRVSDLLKLDTSITRELGFSPLDSIRRADDFQMSGWVISVNGLGSDTIGFRYTDGAGLQYRRQGYPSWKKASYLREVIRLYDLDEYITDLGMVVINDERVYRNVNRNKVYILKRN